MPESIESFVKKLQSEGIAAGEEAAEKIKQEAELGAEKILAEARAEAGKIIDKTKNDADRQRLRVQAELELAVRDTVLKLRETMGRILTAMLTQKVEEQLSDPDYLGEMIREVIKIYTRADAEEHPRIEVNLPQDMFERLKNNTLKDLFLHLGDEEDKLEFKAVLAGAGFGYKIHDATVEVNPDSVSELLSEMVSPALQEILDRISDWETEGSFKDKPGDREGIKGYAGHGSSEGGEDT